MDSIFTVLMECGFTPEDEPGCDWFDYETKGGSVRAIVTDDEFALVSFDRNRVVNWEFSLSRSVPIAVIRAALTAAVAS